MTNKVYKTAMGRAIDLGALLLENESVRAVGNMNVNARGDLLDGSNTVIEQRNKQVQRQYRKQTVGSAQPPATSSVNARKQREMDETLAAEDTPVVQDPLENVFTEPAPVDVPAPQPISIPPGGLAAAIARSREVRQELEKTQKQQAKEKLRKI